MNAHLLAILAFVVAFGGAAIGLAVKKFLPRRHLGSDAKDVIKVAVAVVATLSALVAGLLISSAKSSFDIKNSELKRAGGRIIILNQTLAAYGPATQEARILLRRIVQNSIQTVWPEHSKIAMDPTAIEKNPGTQPIQQLILGLSPNNEAQRWLKTNALQLLNEVEEARWTIFEQTETSVSKPILTVLAFWFAFIFFSFGLFAPPNTSVIAILFICALSVSSAIYLIVEMDQPYAGFIKISDEPLLTALKQLER